MLKTHTANMLLSMPWVQLPHSKPEILDLVQRLEQLNCVLLKHPFKKR